MARALEDSGTQSATVPTEHELDTWTTDEVRVVEVDLNNLANGDAVEIRVYVKDTSAGTDRVAEGYPVVFTHNGTLFQSPPILTFYGGKVTLNQTAGTTRNFDWRVFTLD